MESVSWCSSNPIARMMNIRRRVALHVVVASVGMSIAAPAFAQSRGDVGLSIGYPAAVGLLWQASSGIGVRPEFALDFGSSETISNFGSESSRFSSSYSISTIGISVLYRVYQQEHLSLYLSPRYAYDRLTSTGTGDLSPSDGADRVTVDHTVSGSFGAHYALAPRFGLFGEVGVSHLWSGDGDLLDEPLSPRFTRTGIRSGVGVVLFF